jgi:hypothetical protein
MNTRKKSSGRRQGEASAPQWQQADEDKGSPPDKSGGERAAKGQKGQPGLPDPQKKVWSPGSDLEKSRI